MLDPNWGSLYKEFAGDEEKLIAQVDCQHDGASLCEKYQVESLPTLMFGAGQDKRANFPTSKARISAVFHSFRLIFGRAIISWNGLEAWMIFLERARAEHSR